MLKLRKILETANSCLVETPLQVHADKTETAAKSQAKSK